MPLPFPATLRAIDCDSRGRFGHRALVLLPPAALLGLWLTWSLRAEIPVTADSTAATLQTARMFVIESPADGVVAASGLRLGRRVRAGELLLALDDRDLLARLAALRDRRGALAAAAAALAAQQAAARHALVQDGLAQAAAADEGSDRALQAAAAAALAEQVRTRDARLAAAGLLAAADAAHSRAEAERQRLTAAGALAAMAAARSQGRAAHADRQGAVSRLDGELERLRGDLAGVDAEAAAVERDVARRRVRAPAGGRLGDIAAPPPGGFVARGAALATVVPDAPLRIVALFPALAGAAIRAGQRAWVRLPAGAGGPATPPVLLPAIVAAVAPAAARGRDGWEVELALARDDWTSTADPARDDWTGTPPARAGQACQVAIELERRTPAALALRALGRPTGIRTTTLPRRETPP